MQMKTVIKYHFTHILSAQIKKLPCVVEYVHQENLLHIAGRKIN